MLDQQKIREIQAYMPVLEIEESSWPGYEKLAVLRALEFFHELQEAGGVSRLFNHVSDENHETHHDNLYAMSTRTGGSEFLDAVNGKDINHVLAIFDDHMSTLKVINERAYNNIMRKIQGH